MIATPDDYSWFSSERFPGLAGAHCFTYVRGLTPEELVTRLGARVEDRSHMTLDELIWDFSFDPYAWQTFGAVAVGDWVLMVEANGLLGITEEVITPLSAGTRLVSHLYFEGEGVEDFRWIDDGELRFDFTHDDGYSHWIEDGRIQLKFPLPEWGLQERYSEKTPDELAETMERIDSVYPPYTDPHEGLAFLLAERLTGITLTPQLLKEPTYLCGAVPRSR
ncbi:DUF6461 domain-containing protein [Streptosporangium lutulentum]